MFAVVAVAVVVVLGGLTQAQTAGVASGQIIALDVGSEVMDDCFVLGSALDSAAAPVLVRSNGAAFEVFEVEDSGAIGRSVGRLSLENPVREQLYGAIDPDGAIWIASGQGLAVLDPDTGTSRAVALPQAIRGRIPAGNAGEMQADMCDITGLVCTADGDVWLSRLSDTAVWRLEAGAKTMTAVPIPGGKTFATAIVMAQGGIGVSGFNTETGAYSALAYDPTSSAWTELGAGKVLGCDPSGGFYVYDEVDRSVATRASDGRSVRNAVGLDAANGGIGVIATSANGDVWYLNDGELAMKNVTTGDYCIYDLPDFAFRGKDMAPMPMSTYVDSDGDLWFTFKLGYTEAVIAER